MIWKNKREFGVSWNDGCILRPGDKTAHHKLPALFQTGWPDKAAFEILTPVTVGKKKFFKSAVLFFWFFFDKPLIQNVTRKG